MARGTVRTTNSNQTGNVGVGTTLNQPSGSQVGPITTKQPAGTPLGVTLTGTLTDNANPQGTPINFIQPFGIELGIVVGVKVLYNTVTVNGQVIANCVRLLQRGEILTINPTDDSGLLLDHSSGSTIPYYMAYCN